MRKACRILSLTHELQEEVTGNEVEAHGQREAAAPAHRSQEDVQRSVCW